MSPETVVLADDNGSHPNAVKQEIFDEGPGGYGGEFMGKGEADQHIEVQLCDQFFFLFVQGDQRRCAAIGQHPEGMRLEGHGNGGAPDGLCLLNDFLEKNLMTDMNTVEIADGYHGICEGARQLIDGFNKLHPLSLQGNLCLTLR
jgi:hypothetical protein